jgi:hypothetical protein
MADPKKPEYPGAYSTEAERRAYAEANAAWSDWAAENPEDDEPPRGKQSSAGKPGGTTSA